MSRRPAGAAAFWVVVAGYVLLPWLTRFFPSQDGPTHAYNGYVVLDALVPRESAAFREGFTMSWMPLGNWLSTALLAALELLLPARIAEKVLLSGYGLLFALGGRYWIRSFRPGDTWRSLLLCLFPYHHLFLMGFYNWAIAVPLMLVSAGYWWRVRMHFAWREAALLNLLLTLTYLAHLMAALTAFLALAVMGLATLRERGWGGSFRQALRLLPCGVLPAIFVVFLRSGSEVAESWSPADLAGYLFGFGVLRVHHPAHLALGLLLLVVFAAGLADAFRGGRRGLQPAPLLVGGVLAALFLLLPGYLFSGSFVKERLALAAPLFLLPALSLTPQALRRPTRLFLTAAALANLIYLGWWARALDPAMAEVDAAAARVPPGSRAVPLIFDRYGKSSNVASLRYAASYRWGESGVLDWMNFQSWMPFFPTQLREEHYENKDPCVCIDQTLEKFDPAWMIGKTDAFLTWAMPADSPVRARLLQHCNPHPDNVAGGAEVFLRKRD